MFTVGVDLGKRKSQYAVFDETGELLVERKLPNEPAVVQKFLRSLPGKVAQVGCETCVNTYWLVDLVESIGIPIRVGHALHLRLIAQSRIKTDRIDARVIGELLRIGYFPQIAIPPGEIRRLRELLRGRLKLSRTVAQAKNRLHGLLTRAGIQYEAKDLRGPGVEAWLDGLPLDETDRFLALTYLRGMQDLAPRVREVEDRLVKEVSLREPWAAVVQRLVTIPGVGILSALLLLLELWDIERFPGPKKLASYVGLVPSVHQTGQTLRGGPLTKQGNRYVRWVLVQDGWAAIRSCRRYRGMYEHWARRLGRSEAIVPLARQILFDVYAIWREGITYEELLRRKTTHQQRSMVGSTPL